MNKIEKLRSAVINAEMNSQLRSGQVGIKLESQRVIIDTEDGSEQVYSYGQLIELYKMLQALYGGE